METEAEKKKRLADEAAAAEADAGKKPDDKPAPFAVFETAEAFQARLQRAVRADLKAKGIDPDKIDEQMAAFKSMQEAQAKAADAEKTAVQKAQDAQKAAEDKAAEAMSVAETATMRAHVLEVCAQQGISNTSYAFFAVTNKLAGMKDGEELDEVEFLKGLKADPTQAAALGVATTGAPAKVGANTTDQGGQPESPPKPAGGGVTPPPDAFGQSKDQFAAATQAKYGFTVPG